jgi:PAS domain S-box-containing protein
MKSDSADNFHRLLKRQISRTLPDSLAADPRLKDFLASVSAAYEDLEAEKLRFERTLEISSEELSTVNKKLSQLNNELEVKVAGRTEELEKINAQLLQEIHERHVREKKMQGAELELRHIKQALLEAQHFASLGSFEIDFSNNFSVFTQQAADLLGLSVEELSEMDVLLKNLRKNVEKTDLSRIDEVWTEAMKNQTGFRLDFRLNHPSGERLYLDWIVKAQYDSDGKLLKVSGTLQDVTERIKNEETIKAYAGNLEKINRELDQFAYIVSHDLKAPLRAMFNLSEWIEEDLTGKIDTESAKNFQLLRSRIKRMESLIDGILQYSRAGRIKAEIQPIDLSGFIQDIIANLAPPEKFKISVQHEMPVIAIEKIAMEQVFSNFISNAIKYNTAAEPEISISYADQGQDHLFCVADNGPGIEPQFHEKVFQIFQTLQSRDVIESTGVGLAIVKKIIEEKGGKTWVESEPGNGARFLFTLPKQLS